MSRGYYDTHPDVYPSYVAMKGRCLNPNKSDYSYYGARGVSVCQRWIDSFESFVEDMGPRPQGTSLDRIDVQGDYEPANCKWSTHYEQMNNTRSVRLIEYKGKVLSIAQWARFVGMDKSTLHYRLDHDFTVGESLGYEPKPDKQTLRNRRTQP